jgi:hypothetical protein
MLLLDQADRYLRRRADRKICDAEAIMLLRVRGYSHGEWRKQLGLSPDQYRRANRWLRDAVAAVTPVGGQDLTERSGQLARRARAPVGSPHRPHRATESRCPFERRVKSVEKAA